jgi:hypothetical protein
MRRAAVRAVFGRLGLPVHLDVRLPRLRHVPSASQHSGGFPGREPSRACGDGQALGLAVPKSRRVVLPDGQRLLALEEGT